MVSMFFRYEASPRQEYYHEKAIYSFIFIICNNCHMYFLFCSSSGSPDKSTGDSHAGSINAIHTSSPSRNSTYPTIKTRNHSIHLTSLCHRGSYLADSPPGKDGTGRGKRKQREIGVYISDIDYFNVKEIQSCHCSANFSSRYLEKVTEGLN